MSNFVAAAPSPGRQQRIVVNGTGGRTLLKASIFKSGGPIMVMARGADIDFQFGNSTVTVPVLNSTTDGATGASIASGQWMPLYLAKGTTHVSWIASAEGYLTIMPAGPQTKT